MHFESPTPANELTLPAPSSQRSPKLIGYAMINRSSAKRVGGCLTLLSFTARTLGDNVIAQHTHWMPYALV